MPEFLRSVPVLPLADRLQRTLTLGGSLGGHSCQHSETSSPWALTEVPGRLVLLAKGSQNSAYPTDHGGLDASFPPLSALVRLVQTGLSMLTLPPCSGHRPRAISCGSEPQTAASLLCMRTPVSPSRWWMSMITHQDSSSSTTAPPYR